jgi:hypothetical protein
LTVVPHDVCKLLLVCAAQAKAPVSATVPSRVCTVRDSTFCDRGLTLMHCSVGG